MKLYPVRWLATTSLDGQTARKLRYLNYWLLVCSAACIGLGIASIYFWKAGKAAPAIATTSPAALPFLLLAFWAGRKGRVRLAAWIPVTLLFLDSLLLGSQVGTSQFMPIGFFLATLAAGLVIGTASSLLVALSGSAALIWTIHPQSSAGAQSIALGAGLVILVGLIYLVNKEHEQGQDRQEQMKRDVNLARQDLERQVDKRTEDLHRRLNQIRTAAEISRSISSVLDPQTLLEQVVKLVKNGFSQYYVGVFLLDEPGQYAVLQAGSGEAGQRMMAARHRLAVGGESMIGQATSTGKARIAQDVGQERLRFNNPHLPWTRSELALPILAGGRVLGAMTVQSEFIQAYDADDILILQGIADSLAIALENARLFSQSQASLAEIQALDRQYLEQAWLNAENRPDRFSYSYEKGSRTIESHNGNGAHPESTTALETPLLLRDQEIGRLVIEGEDHSWTEDEQSLVAAITAQAALALENARLLEESRRRASNERLVGEITRKMRETLNIETVLQTAALEMRRALNLAEAEIRLGLPFEEGSLAEKNQAGGQA